MACGNSCLAELGRDFTRLFFAAHAVNDNMAEPFRPFEVAAAAAYRSPAFLREQINSILKFYAPVVRDSHGGFHNQVLDDGTVYDPSTKHVVGTCRFIVNYALAARVAEDDAEVDHHLEFCTHGVNFLINEHVRANASFWLGAPRLSTIGWGSS